MARLLQQVSERPGEGHRSTGPSGNAYIPHPIPVQVSPLPHIASSGVRGQCLYWSHFRAEKAPEK